MFTNTQGAGLGEFRLERVEQEQGGYLIPTRRELLCHFIGYRAATGVAAEIVGARWLILFNGRNIGGRHLLD